uniref:Uncharacterized protein n=1 Tax=Desulfatirhabdium butyrativorans TaxID=340467 RepID=A0A7C4MN41_9BACT
MKDQMKKGIGVVLACMLIVFWGGLTIDKCSAGIDTSMSVRKSEGTLLQYKAGKHVLGFSSEKMYVVGMGYALIEEFVGARAVVPESLGVGGDTSGKEGAADFRGVQYRDLWKAITVKYDPARDGLFESVYIINPGGEPKDIKLKYNTPVQVEQDGTLKFAHPSRKGYFTQSAPVAWQEIGGQKKRVKVGFKTHADHVIGFEVGDYDRTIPLVIDPVYQWHAFYGSGSEDYGYGIAVDTSGNVYVTGKSYVSWNGDGDTAPKHPHSGYIDMVVLKLDKEGLYQWHTFYGSKEFDEGLGIAVDISGNVYVTGQSVASWNGDGGTAPKHPHSGNFDMVVLKLDKEGLYQWHTFYGSYSDGQDIAVDGSGNVYVTGRSYVSWNGDGGTAPKHPHSGNYDMVVLKLDKKGLYQWHTFYGSSSDDYGNGIAVDSSGNVYVTGGSYASWNGDGNTAPKHPHSGNYDMVVLKLDMKGLYQWHTFYGSRYIDHGYDIAVDISGNVYVSEGSSASWNGDGDTSPIHPYSGNYDMVVLKLGKDGLYQWHTFYGSSSDDYGYGIAVDISGNVYVSGGSYASWRGDSNTAPIHPYSGNYDMVVLKLASGDQDQYAVTVNASGTGSGAVSSTPAGIGFTYPAATSGNALFDSGSEIVLTATANAGSSASWSICPGIPAGDGTSVATCTISNLDEAISAAVTFSSQASGPDLTGYWKQMIVKKMGKKYLSIGHLVVQNSGDTDAGSFKVTFYLSEDGVTLGQVLKSTEVGSLKAGSETTLRFVYFSKNPLSGQYMIALIDSDDGVAEKDESNNRVVYQIP